MGPTAVMPPRPSGKTRGEGEPDRAHTRSTRSARAPSRRHGSPPTSRMPSGLSSAQVDGASSSSPAFDALYAGKTGWPTEPSIDEMYTIAEPGLVRPLLSTAAMTSPFGLVGPERGRECTWSVLIGHGAPARAAGCATYHAGGGVRVRGGGQRGLGHLGRAEDGHRVLDLEGSALVPGSREAVRPVVGTMIRDWRTAPRRSLPESHGASGAAGAPSQYPLLPHGVRPAIFGTLNPRVLMK